MDRRAAIAVLAGAIVAVLFAVIATGGEVQLAERSPQFDGESLVVAPPSITVPTTSIPDGAAQRAPWRLPAFVKVILQVVFWACVAFVALLVLNYAWRHRPSIRWRRGRRRRAVEFEVLDDAAAAISADAAEQRAALQRGSPRNAIVECWLRLEAAVIAAGVRREPSDTAAELTERVLANHHVEPAAIARLASLYREARFSEHPMGEDARRSAIEALDDVHQGLEAELSTGVAAS